MTARKTEANKHKLMKTRTGQVIPKPPIRKSKSRSRRGGSFPWPVIERRRVERTTWFESVRDLFKGRA